MSWHVPYAIQENGRLYILEIILTTSVVSIIESLLDNTKVIWYMYYINSTYLVVHIHLTVGRYYCILVYIASSIRK